MFNRLRLKLTLTNVAIVAIILLIFAVGVFVTILKTTNDQTDQLIHLISSNEVLSNSQAMPDKKQREGHELRYFYVKLDTKNNITYTSSDFVLKNEDINSLIEKALSRPKKMAT